MENASHLVNRLPASRHFVQNREVSLFSGYLLEIHSKYVLAALECALGGSISLSGAFPLHEKVFSLRSRKGAGTQYGYVSEKSLPVAIEPEPLQSTQSSFGEMFGTFLEAKLLVERWRREYNHRRPHSRLTFEMVQSMELAKFYNKEIFMKGERK